MALCQFYNVINIFLLVKYNGINKSPKLINLGYIRHSWKLMLLLLNVMGF